MFGVTKFIIFGLNGVLVDINKIHFDALNRALVENGYSEIGDYSQETITYDGLTTKLKLDMMDIPEDVQDKIFDSKQKHTFVALRTVKRNHDILDLFEQLRWDGYTIGVCSYDTEKVVDNILDQMLLSPYLSIRLCGVDMKNPKPHPEIYWEAMSEIGSLPRETVIIENSNSGLESAIRSGAYVVPVSSPEEVDVYLIDELFKSYGQRQHGGLYAGRGRDRFS